MFLVVAGDLTVFLTVVAWAVYVLLLYRVIRLVLGLDFPQSNVRTFLDLLFLLQKYFKRRGIV